MSRKIVLDERQNACCRAAIVVVLLPVSAAHTPWTPVAKPSNGGSFVTVWRRVACRGTGLDLSSLCLLLTE
eukprot:6186253-Pleurochrysis_carterae.AAC.6